MNKVAIAFLTKDRTELSQRTIEPLLQPDKFDTWWFDGSTTKEGTILPSKHQVKKTHFNVRGGPDAAVAFALSALLDYRDAKLDGNVYTHIGIVENDVLLNPGWFVPTFELFNRGPLEGLAVGAVSARAYEDRILFQRDGYSVMHNLGWGMQVMTREAAEIALRHMRTSWTTENRRVFAQASGLDIGRWWAFRAHEGPLCADWGNDRILAAHGLASLALTPSPVEMIGQTPALHEQGLVLADKPVELLRNDKAFQIFVERMHSVRFEKLALAADRYLQQADGSTIYFAHQCKDLGAQFTGAWQLKWAQGFGPFGWQALASTATDPPVYPCVTIPILGPVSFLVTGGPKGGEIKVEDLDSGYECPVAIRPDEGQLTLIAVPAGPGSYRNVRLTAVTPGPTFFGIRTMCQQPVDLQKASRFRHSDLPPMGV